MSTITTEAMLGSARSSISKPLPDLPPVAASLLQQARLSYTLEEAAQATGLTKRKLQGAIVRGQLKCRIIGRTAVIPASALKKLVGETS